MVHLALDPVFTPKQVLLLQLPENFEDCFPLFLYCLLAAEATLCLFLATDLIVEVTVEIILMMRQQGVKNWQFLQSFLEFSIARFLVHPKPSLFEVAFDLSLYCLVFLSDIFHEELKYLMGRCTSLVHHVKQSFVTSIVSNKFPPFGLICQLSRSQFFPQHLPESASVSPISQPPLLCHEFFVLLLCFQDVINEGAQPIIRVQLFPMLIGFVGDTGIIPFCVMLEAVFLKLCPKGINMLPLLLNSSLLFLLPQLLHVGLECILSLVFLQESPPRVSHEVICHLMHLAVRCQILVLLQHLQKLSFVHLDLGTLLLLTDLLQIRNVLIEVLLFLPHPQRSPSLIIFAQLDAGVPLCCHPDQLVFEKPHEFPLQLLSLGNLL